MNGAPRRHYTVTFGLLALVGVSYALLQSLVAPALPDMQRALHTSVNGVSWVLTAYLLSASIATPPTNRVSFRGRTTCDASQPNPNNPVQVRAA